MRSNILMRASIPPRLLDEMMLKEAAGFDVPATPEGIEFQQWWAKTSATERDQLMKTAYAHNISLLEALALNEVE